MPDLTKQKGRLNVLHVKCTSCGTLYAVRLRTVPEDGQDARDENDDRVADHLANIGWTGSLTGYGATSCHRCNGRPPSRRARIVNIADESTYDPWG
jgi:hypothetical protein